MEETPTTLYELVGGEPWFVALVDRFYDGVEHDPLLRPMYPDDLTGSRDHMVGFLVQYWGGPGTYSEQRGHPRLRMRHAPFPIGDAERDAWYRHMADAVRGGGLPAEVEASVLAYFESASAHLINAR
jgi:hemoglobin